MVCPSCPEAGVEGVDHGLEIVLPVRPMRWVDDYVDVAGT